MASINSMIMQAIRERGMRRRGFPMSTGVSFYQRPESQELQDLLISKQGWAPQERLQRGGGRGGGGGLNQDDINIKLEASRRLREKQSLDREQGVKLEGIRERGATERTRRTEEGLMARKTLGGKQRILEMGREHDFAKESATLEFGRKKTLSKFEFDQEITSEKYKAEINKLVAETRNLTSAQREALRRDLMILLSGIMRSPNVEDPERYYKRGLQGLGY